MEKTGCTCYFYTEGIERNWTVFKQRPDEFRGFQVPQFDDMISLGEAKGPFSCHGAETPEEKVLIMHSSGSTGMPKPIFLDSIWVTAVLRQKYLVPPPGRNSRAEGWLGPSTDGKPLITSAPMYHGMSFLLFLRSIFTGPLVNMPAGVPLSANVVMEAMETKLATCGMFPPSIIADLTATERGLKALSTLDDVFYGGAPLSRQAGERVNSVTRLSSILGSVETCCIAALAPLDQADWDYYEFHPYSGAIFEDVGEGLAELVIKPIGDLRHQPIFSGFPGISEWRTSDLFEQHPAKTGLWRFKCRRDDVLVLSSGIKYDPIMFEKTVENHPLVKGALIVGHEHFQLGLILELDWEQLEQDQERDQKALLELLWPAIEAANLPNARNTCIVKNMVVFTSKEKPFARTAKHSIARRATLDLYAPEIDQLYSSDRVDEQFSDELGRLGREPDSTQLRDFIRRALEFLLQRELPDEELSDDDIIFDMGIDSVSVVVLVKGLRQALDDSVIVSAVDVYSNPTISKLAAVLINKLSSTGKDGIAKTSQSQLIEQLVTQFTADLPPHPSHTSVPPRPARHTVILTGSTGSLGSYILQTLLPSPSIEKIYCLNRTPNAHARQARIYADRGHPLDLSPVTFLHTDLSQPEFGLPSDTYTTLLATATLFIHAAWAVNFNLPLAAFAPTHLAGTRHAIAFSQRSAHACHIALVSSIASVAGAHPPVRETLLSTDAARPSMGYGASKHAAERILAASGAPASILRCGQLCGPRAGDGSWNRREWLPALVASSARLGVVPMALGAGGDVVEWLPVDVAAQAVVELSLAACGSGQEALDVFHVVNPRGASWSRLVPVIQAFYGRQGGGGKEVRGVAFEAWVDALKKVPQTREALEEVPSVKIVEFYESMAAGAFPSVSSARAVACSSALAGATPIDAALFARWLEQWASAC